MVKNRKLSRAISDLGWRSFRTMLEAKAEKYGRDLRIINRWEATSQKCSCCGEKGGKKELNIREWTCLFCGAEHDRDINASQNILNVAVGHTETKNGRRRKCQTGVKSAVSSDASTRQEFPEVNSVSDRWESPSVHGRVDVKFNYSLVVTLENDLASK